MAKILMRRRSEIAMRPGGEYGDVSSCVLEWWRGGFVSFEDVEVWPSRSAQSCGGSTCRWEWLMIKFDEDDPARAEAVSTTSRVVTPSVVTNRIAARKALDLLAELAIDLSEDAWQIEHKTPARGLTWRPGGGDGRVSGCGGAGGG